MIVIQCDACTNTCKGKMYEIQALPNSWITIIQRNKEDKYYCSHACLLTSLQASLTQMPPPTCKMRRFLLVDGDAEEYEGVLWGSGKVSIAHADPLDSWKDFKYYYPGCGVTWIDQEGGE